MDSYFFLASFFFFLCSFFYFCFFFVVLFDFSSFVRIFILPYDTFGKEKCYVKSSGYCRPFSA